MKEKIIKEFQDMVSSSEMITDYWLEKKLDQYADWKIKELMESLRNEPPCRDNNFIYNGVNKER